MANDVAEDCRTAARGLRRSPMLTGILHDAAALIDRYEEALHAVAAMPPAGAFHSGQIARDALKKEGLTDGS
jgi:hypothetical protein